MTRRISRLRLTPVVIKNLYRDLMITLIYFYLVVMDPLAAAKASNNLRIKCGT